MIIIVMAAIIRLLPHEPNVAPIGALALFSGAYLSKKQGLAVPISAMLISDFFLGFHNTMVWVYGSFLLTVLMGYWLRGNLNWKNVFLASTASSVLFFLITNFGVWASTTMYQKNLAGLFESYLMGLPFFRNSLVGDFGYNLIFFGGYALINAWSRQRAWKMAEA